MSYEEPSLFDAPPLARRTDPDTSHAAGADVAVREFDVGGLRATGQCAALLVALADMREGADFEVAQRAVHQGRPLYRAHVCYWHRVGDLVQRGLAVDTDERRVNPDTGKARRVVRITKAGEQVAAQLRRVDLFVRRQSSSSTES